MSHYNASKILYLIISLLLIISEHVIIDKLISGFNHIIIFTQFSTIMTEQMYVRGPWTLDRVFVQLR
jgi:hypothetical protein